MQTYARLLTDRYDYNNLLKEMPWDDREAALSYFALTRLDSILFERIVLSDAQFITSRFFLNAASIKMDGGHSLLAKLPLQKMEIRCRRNSLESALLSFACDRDGGTLRPQLYPAIKHAAEIRQALPKVRASAVGTWRDIPKILRDCGADPSEADRLDEGWGHMLEASTKTLPVVEWTPFDWPAEFNRTVQAEVEAFKATQLRTDYGKVVLQEALGKSRAQVVVDLEIAQAQHLNDTARSDLQAVASFHARCYNRTLARQHDCDSTELDDSGQPASRQTKEGCNHFHRLLAALTVMDDRKFSSLDAHAGQLQPWYRLANVENLRSVWDQIVADIDPTLKPSPALQRIARRVRNFADTSVGIIVAPIFGYQSNDIVVGMAAGAAAAAIGFELGEKVDDIARDMDVRERVKIAVVDRATRMRHT